MTFYASQTRKNRVYLSKLFDQATKNEPELECLEDTLKGIKWVTVSADEKFTCIWLSCRNKTAFQTGCSIHSQPNLFPPFLLTKNFEATGRNNQGPAIHFTEYIIVSLLLLPSFYCRTPMGHLELLCSACIRLHTTLEFKFHATTKSY